MATAAYRTESDAVARFLAECCEVNPNVRSTTADLFKGWEPWAVKDGVEPMSQKAFGLAVDRHGYPPGRRPTASVAGGAATAARRRRVTGVVPMTPNKIEVRIARTFPMTPAVLSREGMQSVRAMRTACRMAAGQGHGAPDPRDLGPCEPTRAERRRTAPAGPAPLSLGPCARCGARCVRYGPDGAAFCSRCLTAARPS